MPATVRVDPCDRRDADLLAWIAETTFRETYTADTEGAEMERHVAKAYDPTAIEQELAEPGSRFFLAWLDEVPAGYLKINLAEAQTELREEEGLEIESLYVLREFQGGGVGRLLFDRALDEARRAGVNYIWLGVWERNVRARQFWEKQGFAAFGAHPFRFGDLEHTDLMMRRAVQRGAD